MVTKFFTPDIDQPICIVQRFDATSKYVLFTITLNIYVSLTSNTANSTCTNSAFDDLMKSFNLGQLLHNL
jgi:hypothetical protein